MNQVFKIDNNGFYIEPVIIHDDEQVPSDCIEIYPTEGLFKHKWDGTTWVEGLSQEEIDAIKNAPVPKSNVEIIGEQLVLERLERLKAKQQRDSIGKELVGLKLEVMQLKGGQTV